MFAIMYETEDGKVFKIYKTQLEAMDAANNIACMGMAVTVFDCDADTNEYFEFFSI